MLRRLLLPIILITLGLPSLALADQLAQISEVNSQSSDYSLIDNGPTSETLNASGEIYFSFNSTLPTGIAQNTDAILTLNATTSTAASVFGSSITEIGLVGTFTITDDVAGADYGTNLLSGSFKSGAYISTATGTTTMTFQDGDIIPSDPNEVTFTSAYLNFAGYSGNEAFAFSMSSLNPAASVVYNFLANSTAAGTATFQATPLPPPVAPEPGTVVLGGAALLAGIGFSLRKRHLRMLAR